MLLARNLTKSYRRGQSTVEALRGVSFEMSKGEFVAVMGPSGSGKSTLVHLLGALDRPTSGTVSLAGEALDRYSDSALAVFRRRKLGFVFQFFHLMPTLSAEENVILPLVLDGARPSRVIGKARKLLEELGLNGRTGHRPDQLSGGEIQRVAIARALVADPVVLLADEPTGNLDVASGRAVLALLRRLVDERSLAILMVTHDRSAARVADRVLSLRDGSVEAEGPPDKVLGSEPRDG